MIFDSINDSYLDDDFTGNQDSDDENWGNFEDDGPESDEMEWLEDIESDEFDDYSYEEDYDDLDSEDF